MNIQPENRYQLQATEFLKTHNLSMLITTSEIQDAPIWGENDNHGVKYDIRVTNELGITLQFPFWDSLHNKQGNLVPTEYDVLACMSSCQDMEPDEVYYELGPMKPSDCIAVSDHSKMVIGFFTAAQMSDLREIQ